MTRRCWKLKFIVAESKHIGTLMLSWKEILGQQYTKTDKVLWRFIKTTDMKGFGITNWNNTQMEGKKKKMYLSTEVEERFNKEQEYACSQANWDFCCHFIRDKNEFVHMLRKQNLFSSLCILLRPRRKKNS